MVSLEDLLSVFPVGKVLISSLPSLDLYSLSESSLPIRSALCAFFEEKGVIAVVDFIKTSRLTPAANKHVTIYLNGVKTKGPVSCSEPQHTRGDSVRDCRMCSIPVCEACVFKASFGKRHNKTHHNRLRFLCVDCWDAVHSGKERLLHQVIDSYCV